MSRNLNRTRCYYCEGEVTLREMPRPIRQSDCGVYYDHFEGMLVAQSECVDCEAKYLAWVDERPRVNRDAWNGMVLHQRVPSDGPGFFDLSFRSSFNDEAGMSDMPKHRIEVRRVRAGAWPTCYVCGKPTYSSCSQECIWFGTNAAAAHGVRQEAITAALAVLREACGEAFRQ